MTQVKLLAAALTAEHTEEGCPFCRPAEEVNETNHLRADYDEDTEADNDTDNSSGTLAKNLVSRPRSPARQVPAPLKGESAPVQDMYMADAPTRKWHGWIYEAGITPVLYGAHHLLPGNDGLADSNLYQNGWLGDVDNGADPSNIGYNINGRLNGMWLPGNYAIRSSKHRPSQATWSATDPDFQQAYAFLAMLNCNRQFHDAHTDYSETVEMTLNDLEELMEEMEQDGCPACGAGEDPEDPPYHLNSRLNAISSYLFRHLQGSPLRWKDTLMASDKWGKKYKDFVRKCGSVRKARAELEKLA